MSNKSRYWKYEFTCPRPGNVSPYDDDGGIVVVVVVVGKLKVTKI